MHYPLKAESWL